MEMYGLQIFMISDKCELIQHSFLEIWLQSSCIYCYPGFDLILYLIFLPGQVCCTPTTLSALLKNGMSWSDCSSQSHLLSTPHPHISHEVKTKTYIPCNIFHTMQIQRVSFQLLVVCCCISIVLSPPCRLWSFSAYCRSALVKTMLSSL